MKKIQDDQFLDLLTVKTEVRAVCKEPYRLNHRSECLCFLVYSTVYVGWRIWHDVHFKCHSFSILFFWIIMHLLFIIWCTFLNIHLQILFVVCSIYKAVLKSKSSISEINQIAQVCFLLW